MISNNSMDNMQPNFYRAFEDKFRGTRDTIMSRLRVYLPFIEPLKQLRDACSAIDLGCGRGEWLELMAGIDMVAHGVDLDEEMLAACRERNLSVEISDAISFLKQLPSESQDVVSGFHIIEHILFSDLQILIQEAYRVLRPAGLLILETPNPENIVVSSTTFHLDPSHLKPIPPSLLAFLTEYYGFYRNKLLRLQEPFDPTSNKLPNLFNVLYGVSWDYSIVAQKQATAEQLQGFDVVFGKEHGFSLETLVNHYDIQVAQTLENIYSRLSNLRVELDSTRVELGSTRVELDSTRVELKNIYYSRSWRITAPLRKFGDIGRSFQRQMLRLFPLGTLPKRVLFRVLRIVGVKIIIPLSENRTAYAIVNRFPRVKRQIQRLMKRVIYEPQQVHLPAFTVEQSIPMSPVVMRIYLDLVNHIKNHNQED